MSTFAKVLMAVAFFIFVMAIGYQVATNQSSEDFERLHANVEELEQGNEKLRTQNADLRSDIRSLHEDSRAIEHRVRDDLGMVRRDEILILLNRPE